MFRKDLLKILEQFRSDLTGMLHINFAKHDHNSETIPLYENGCYCLLLLRTHDKKKMLFAMELLEKLLLLQSDKGAFPLYFHQFPVVHKMNLSLRWILPLFWINKNYSHVMPVLLREKVIAALKKLFDLDEFDRYILVEKEFRGEFYNEEILGEVKSSRDLIFRGLLLNIAGEKIKDTLFDRYYDLSLSRYVGPATHEFQLGTKTKDALLHLLVDQEIDIKKLSPYELLQASLIFTRIPMEKRESRDRALFLIDHFDPRTTHISNLKGLHILRLLTKNKSIVCQSGQHLIQTQEFDDRVEIDFTFLEDKGEDDNMNIAFYTERSDRLTKFLVDQQKANLFHIDSEVEILLDDEKFLLRFMQLEGEGDIVGHIQFGNRPAQTCPKMKSEYKLYDWMVAIRGIRYKKGFKLRAILSLR